MATVETLGEVQSNRDYHADHEWLSHSMLEVFRKSPAKYHAIYVAKTIPTDPPPREMILGSLTHLLVLQDEPFDRVFLLAEGCNSRRGKAWERYVDEAAEKGLTPVLPCQYEMAIDMAGAVKKHELSMRILDAPGPVETPIRWKDAATGLTLKCKPDKLSDNPAVDFLLNVDLKTARDPGPSPDPEVFDGFPKQAWHLGYHRQSAHYEDGVETIATRPTKRVYVVVGNTKPHDVYVYHVKDGLLDEGRIQNAETRRQLAKCYQAGEWCRPEEISLQPLEAPPWRR
jgi:hypothetical protein